MKKIKSIAIPTILLLFISSCNLPFMEAEPTVDIVATQVAVMLTGSATTAAQESEALPTETLAPSPTHTEPVPETTPTETPTITETPTPTLDQNDPAQLLGAPAWTEDFSGSSSPWDFDSVQATFNTSDGALNLTAKANANWHSWYISSPKLKNAYIETTLEMSNCSGLDRFGLIVRATSEWNQFYFMGFTCDGQWGFFRMEPDVNINQIIGFQPVEPLDNGTNAPHRVGIWMKDSTFTFFIDGKEVGTASDTKIAGDGYTGFLIAYANNPGFTVRVDELHYWNVP